MPTLLASGPDDARWTLLLAHGAGATMDSPFMNQMAALLGERGVRTLRFEFGYMAARREGGGRRPPPRAELLVGEYRAQVEAAAHAIKTGALAIGGKSMGGRVASLLAAELTTSDPVRALVCLGYPFHPPNRPTQLRTGPLHKLGCPTLIVQGERDPFAGREEVTGYNLREPIRLHWASDGDHDLGPRGGSGFTRKGNLAIAADAIASFLASVAS